MCIRDSMKEEQLLAGCTTEKQKAAKWKAVKMIRIAAKPGIDSIPQNAELKEMCIRDRYLSSFKICTSHVYLRRAEF